jgi:hypothetical protein
MGKKMVTDRHKGNQELQDKVRGSKEAKCGADKTHESKGIGA